MKFDERYVDDVDYDEDELADEDAAEEWQEGECDMCLGSTPEDLARASEPDALVPVCACALGQGAPADECRCGPEDLED
ncbi:hypothetical protein AB0N17_03070 [Streptomyces sp. NPDC051133]|uniref:hypothetical protein n=1 Tax=Streptomyces sp. NPDC051133 TaxID=3155521 RepID=UPI00341B7741